MNASCNVVRWVHSCLRSPDPLSCKGQSFSAEKIERTTDELSEKSFGLNTGKLNRDVYYLRYSSRAHRGLLGRNMH